MEHHSKENCACSFTLTSPGSWVFYFEKIQCLLLQFFLFDRRNNKTKQFIKNIMSGIKMLNLQIH